MKIRLHWKLSLLFVSVLGCGLLLGYFHLSAHINNYFDSFLEQNVRRQLLLGRSLLETHIKDAHSLADADQLADKIGGELGLRSTIIDAGGKVIGDSEVSAQELSGLENHLDREEIQEAARQGAGSSRRYSYTLKKYLLYMAVPFSADNIKGYLRFSLPLSEIALLEARPQRIILVTLTIMFALGAGFTLLVVFLVSRPLREMSALAQSMAAGDFSRKPAVNSSDEVGDLARALSFMSDQIQDKINRIKQEGAKLDAVIASMFEGMIVTDEKGAILLVNPSIRRIFLVDNEPQGRKPIEVIRNNAIQEMVDSILKDKKMLLDVELSVTNPEEKYFRVNGAPILRGGLLEGAILVFHDITRLRSLEKVRQDFVANVSHELRTPVTSIKGYAETLLHGAMDDKDNLRDFITIIYHDAGRLGALIDDLLDLSKIESGKMPMVMLPIDIKALVGSCVKIVEKQATAKSLRLSVDIQDECAGLKGDEKRLTQVFLNLLDNAIKYTSEGGSITVEVSKKKEMLQARVSDTGIGIPEQDLARIFERFYRVDKARSRELGGTGLGLSIVKHIIIAHGGEVWVHSAPGKGSTFGFTIPFQQ